MSIHAEIESKLTDALAPVHLQVVNESHLHNVPPGSESHFRVTLVSDSFRGKRMVARHQRVYAALADEIAGGVHALALHTYTTEEWRERHGEAPMSPPCRGGSKADAP